MECITEHKPALTLQVSGDEAANVDERVDEAVIGISPVSDEYQHKTLIDMPYNTILKELVTGIEEEGLHAQVVRISCTSDVSFVTQDVANLSGSDIGIGIQSKGTTVIRQHDLLPLSNLELFSQALLLTLGAYHQIGKNAACYAHKEPPSSVPVVSDQMVRPKSTAKAALFHIEETKHAVWDVVPVTLHIAPVRG